MMPESKARLQIDERAKLLERIRAERAAQGTTKKPRGRQVKGSA